MGGAGGKAYTFDSETDKTVGTVVSPSPVFRLYSFFAFPCAGAATLSPAVPCLAPPALGRT